MAAANTDKWRKKKSVFSTTLNGAIGSTDTTIVLASASGLATDTAITLTIDRVDSSGASTPSLRERVTGVISSNSLTTSTRGVDSTTAQSHSSGAVVEDIWDAATWNDAIDSFLAEHNQAGTHKFTTVLDTNSNESLKLGTTASAVNEVTITNAATGSGPTIETTGGDTNAPITLKGKGTGHVTLGQATSTDVRLAADQPIADSSGNELIKVSKVASAVNEITVANAATGNAPTISATGGDANIDLTFAGKGTGKVREDARYGTITSDTDGATVTFNMATSNLHTVTLAGNRILAVSNVAVGQTFIIRLVQDATGSRTVTWFSTIKWAGGSAPTLTTTAGKADILGFICTSSGNYDGFVVGANV